MGGDAQIESLVQLRNTSKPNKWVCLKYKFNRLVYLTV